MSEKSLTEQMIDAIVVHMDEHDLQPVTFLKENHSAYTCIGAARGLSVEGVTDDKPYFMTVGLDSLGLISEGRVDEAGLREALKLTLNAGMRGHDENGDVISFM